MQFAFGSGLLWASRTDIANATPVRFGALQDVSVDFDGELKELYSQYQFPIDVARGKTKITGKAKLARISSIQYNNMFFGQTVTTGQKLTAYDEADTTSAGGTGTTNATTASSSAVLHFTSTPASCVVGCIVTDTTSPAVITAGSFIIAVTATTATMNQNAAGAGVGATDALVFSPVVTVANSANYIVDLGVRYSATGNPLALTTAALVLSAGLGNYALTFPGSYAFSPADLSVAMLFDYVYSTTSGQTVTGNNLLMGSSPRFIMTFSDNYESQTATLRLFACASTKLSFATKIDDYVIPELDFSAYANAAQQVYEFTAAT